MTKKQKNMLLIGAAVAGGYYFYTKSKAPTRQVVTQPVVAAKPQGIFSQLLAGATDMFGAMMAKKEADAAKEKAQAKLDAESTVAGYIDMGSLSGCGGSLGCNDYGSLG